MNRRGLPTFHEAFPPTYKRLACNLHTQQGTKDKLAQRKPVFISRNHFESSAENRSINRGKQIAQTKLFRNDQINKQKPYGRSSIKIKGLNEGLLDQRKQNHLNTCLKNRKVKRIAIQIENQKMHQRINSQKSLYSSVDLSDSRTSLKKRNSSSKLSSRSKKSISGIIQGEKKPRIQFKPTKIDRMRGEALSGFQQMFGGSQKQPSKRLTSEDQPSNHHSFNLNGKGDNFLHRIAEEMFEKDPQKTIPSRKILPRFKPHKSIPNQGSLKNYLNF